jgi:hypothetical protein
MNTKRLIAVFLGIDLIGVAAITAAYWWLFSQGI